jgi:hypothetical protein
LLDDDSGVVRRRDSLGFSVLLFSASILFMPSNFFHYCQADYLSSLLFLNSCAHCFDLDIHA